MRDISAAAIFRFGEVMPGKFIEVASLLGWISLERGQKEAALVEKSNQLQNATRRSEGGEPQPQAWLE